MRKIMATELLFTEAQIIEAAAKWSRFEGFTGEQCSGRMPHFKGGRCGLLANILAGGAGWFCTCGHYNVLSWNNRQLPHQQPDLGPTAFVIISALKALKEGRRAA